MQTTDLIQQTPPVTSQASNYFIVYVELWTEFTDKNKILVTLKHKSNSN